jgi:demethylmenaquinone methyltransferase/2-methoxy-6-polyprenyl-1,4-benzoquinol methylase
LTKPEDKAPRSQRPLTRADSRVEIHGAEARHYDLLMNVITFGTYPFFIRRAVRDLDIGETDAILDLGAGTGRNACLMLRYLSPGGRIVGLDVSEEMLSQARRRCRRHPNVSFERRRIEKPLPYREEFDKVFIAFVLHGLVQEDRLEVVRNAWNALKAGGEFLILDYNEIDLERSSLITRYIFERIECPLAADFVGRDWKGILSENGFWGFRSRLYYSGNVRLLGARKPRDR